MPFWTTVKHYSAGLLTSSWDAGIASIQLLGGVAVASNLAPQTLSQLDIKHMAAVFVAAAFWEAIDYFKEHPLEKLVEDPSPDKMSKPPVASPVA